jgi:uncharacterized membrane protein
MNKAAGVLVSVVIFLGLLAIFFYEPEPTIQMTEATRPFREMLWNFRSLDLIGQMMIILAGTFGVLVLTKERIER